VPIELLDQREKKDEVAENVVEACERLIRHLANVPIETSFLSFSTPGRHDVEPWPDQEVRKPVPIEEVTNCLKLIAAPRILRGREVVAFKTAMSLVADAFEDPLDLKVQIIKFLREACDCQN